MPTFFRVVLADVPPDPPLVGNNLVFYGIVGGVLLGGFLLALWMRCGPRT